MKNWSPEWLCVSALPAVGLVQVVHRRDPRDGVTARVLTQRSRGRSLWIHLGKPGSCWLLPIELRCLDEANAAFLAQAVAVAANGDDLAVEQAVEDGGGEDGIAEHGVPLADRAVGGDEQAAALVAARDELEEQMRGVGLERQVAEFVDDQERAARACGGPPGGCGSGSARSRP